MVNEYPNFAALAKGEREGVDFERAVKPRVGAHVLVIAPHGGRIEPHTDAIASAIAKEDLSLYCFQSRKPTSKGNLHITSHNFDDPECVELAAKHRSVIAIHGCKKVGQRVLLGGRDASLVAELASSLKQAGIHAETTGHKYLGTDRNNICNRGATGAGVQFELSMQFRRGALRKVFVQVVRKVLLARQNAA
jgi:phage replication-related protein YjqB (UPF0714/DUF867 family)